MAAAVAGEECDAFAFEKSGDDGFGGIAERSFHANLLGVGEAFHGIEAASADDADGRLARAFWPHFSSLFSKQVFPFVVENYQFRFTGSNST